MLGLLTPNSTSHASLHSPSHLTHPSSPSPSYLPTSTGESQAFSPRPNLDISPLPPILHSSGSLSSPCISRSPYSFNLKKQISEFLAPFCFEDYFESDCMQIAAQVGAQMLMGAAVKSSPSECWWLLMHVSLWFPDKRN